MTKRILVVGSRDFEDYDKAKRIIDISISKIKSRYNLIFVSGGARGADALGERYAKENGFKIEIFPAEWEKYGKSAGPKRNEEMVKLSDYILCFWDGKSKGTKSTIGFAKIYNKPFKIIKV